MHSTTQGSINSAKSTRNSSLEASHKKRAKEFRTIYQYSAKITEESTVNNTVFDMLDYSEDNTDDEQEDLPYDGDLQHLYQLHCISENLEDFTSVENASPGLFTLTSPEICSHLTEKSDCRSHLTQRNISLASFPRENDLEFTMVTEKKFTAGDFNCSGRNQHFSSSKMSDVLLRHFPKEEFCPLIDSETIPEISFTESVDETILNQIKNSENTGTTLTKEEKINLERYSSEREGKCESAEKTWDLVEDEFVIDEKKNSSCDREDYLANNQWFATQKEDTINDELNYFSNPKEECEEQKHFLEMTDSSPNLKYGQRQVHYRLPDFSKIAPKVKIPKGNNKSASIIKQTKSSPNVLGISAIVEDVLEGMNSLESVAVKNLEHGIRIPELDQQLELLTKQAEAQNHIDHLRFNTKLLPHSNSHNPNIVIKRQDRGVTSEGSTTPSITVPVRPMLGFPQSSLSEVGSQRMVSPLPSAGATRQSFVSHPPLQKATEGEEVSQMLKEQTEELKTKVENFSKCVAQDVVPVQECHQFFMLLKEQLSLLEQNYLAMREKHGVLQLQNYKHSSTSTGEFDPDRKMEGEMFKLEMLLEDIKEKVDKRHNLHSSTIRTSPSLTPCESVCSSFASHCESPVVSSIIESPSKTTIGLKVSDNEKYGEDRNHPVEVISEKIFQNLNPGGRNLSYWEMRYPPPTNQLSTTANLTVLKEKGGFAYPSDDCFPETLENATKENIFLHPRLKIQLSSKQICSCSSSRTKNMDYRRMNRGKSDCDRFSIFLEGKTAALDSSGSDIEDSSFCSFMGNSSNKMFLEQRTRSNQSCRLNLKEQNKALPDRDWKTHFYADSQGNNYSKKCKEREIAFSQKKSIALQRIYASNQPEQVTDRLSDSQLEFKDTRKQFFNFCSCTVQTRYSRMYDTIIHSPQYLTSRNTHGKRSMSNLRKKHIKDTDTKILNSTLDHVIQTANSLKRTTEHMMQLVSEDLAKTKTQITNTAATKYYN
ncbi:protein AKNAD1 [Tiliqua scincoides]|uniref:protein AKNAD1 n=1 Tax=Tiliqua scincoides TaxID=71010 RepID=UPI0034626E3F